MIDILAFGAHPDDCEFFMSGTLLTLKKLGYRTGICDLTRGEAGTYGTPETRRAELDRASELLELDARVTLDFPDGGIRNTEKNRLDIIEVIRTLRPEQVFSFADIPLRHPDHAHCGSMVRECCYLAGLEKIETASPAFRPSSFVGFPELWILTPPDFVVDVTDVWEKRTEVIRSFSTQVVQPGEEGDTSRTFIRSQRFWHIQEARGGMAGALAGVKYGEPFYSETPPRVLDTLEAFRKEIK